MSRIERRTIIDALAEGLRLEPYVLAVGLGGSFASGRVDEFSDIDLTVVVEDEHVEDGFVRLEAILTSLSPIELHHRLPEPTWHGHSQAFLRLAYADPHHFVDVCVMKRSAPDKLTERERHGDAQILFDPEGLLGTAPFDRPAHDAKMLARLAVLRETYPMFQPLLVRAVARGHVAEATYWYVNLTLKGLVEILRMRHCPDRYDFGLRYLDRDLPPEIRVEIEQLAYPRDADELAGFQLRAQAHFESELQAFDRGEWGEARS